MIDLLWKKIGTLWSSNPTSSEADKEIVPLIPKVLEGLPKRWGLLRLDRAKIELIVFMLAFDLRNVGSLVDSFLRASRGDYSGMAGLSMMYHVGNSMSPIVWGDMLLKGLSDFDSSRDYKKDMLPGKGEFNSYASYVYFGWIDEATCRKAGISPTLCPVEDSPVETLIVSGSIDFSTPAEFSTKELLPKLPHARQVIISEAGHHNLWQGWTDSFRHLVQTFLDRGDVDMSGYEYRPLVFGKAIPLVRFGWILQCAMLAVPVLALALIVYLGVKWLVPGI